MSFLRKFLMFSIFLSMLNLPSYAGIIGLPPAGPPKADDFCGYYDEYLCKWETTKIGDNTIESCHTVKGKTIYCGHSINTKPFPCLKSHPAKQCNRLATRREDCVLVDHEAICSRLPNPKKRECYCTCKSADGREIDNDSTASWTQNEPYTQSCQEEFESGLPAVLPNGTPNIFPPPCKGYVRDEDGLPIWPLTEVQGTMQCEITNPVQNPAP